MASDPFTMDILQRAIEHLGDVAHREEARASLTADVDAAEVAGMVRVALTMATRAKQRAEAAAGRD